MLPTCIGISGVSRYRNDASIDDSFLASLMLSSLEPFTRRLAGASGVQTVPIGSRRSGLCLFRRRICNGKRPRSVKLTELALGLRQTVGDRPQSGRVHAQSGMTGEVHLDILGDIGGTQEAGSPINDTVGSRIDRRRRHRQIARNRLSKLGISAD